jgi:hypothetical protein
MFPHHRYCAGRVEQDAPAFRAQHHPPKRIIFKTGSVGQPVELCRCSGEQPFQTLGSNEFDIRFPFLFQTVPASLPQISNNLAGYAESGVTGGQSCAVLSF